MTGIKIIAAATLVGAGVTLSDTWQAWEKLGLAGILLVGLVALYISNERTRIARDKDASAREKELREALLMASDKVETREVLLRETLQQVAAAGQRTADFIGECTAQLRKVESVITHCQTVAEARVRRG